MATADPRGIREFGRAAVDRGHRRATISCQRPVEHDAEDTMKYLCLVYHDEAAIEALPASEYDAIKPYGLVAAFAPKG